MFLQSDNRCKAKVSERKPSRHTGAGLHPKVTVYSAGHAKASTAIRAPVLKAGTE